MRYFFQPSLIPVALRNLFMKQLQCSVVHCIVWLTSARAAERVNEGVGEWVVGRFRWVSDYITIQWKGNWACRTWAPSSVIGSWTSCFATPPLVTPHWALLSLRSVSSVLCLSCCWFTLLLWSMPQNTSWATMADQHTENRQWKLLVTLSLNVDRTRICLNTTKNPRSISISFTDWVEQTPTPPTTTTINFISSS